MGMIPDEYGATLREAIRTGEKALVGHALSLGEEAAAAGIPATAILPIHSSIIVEELAAGANQVMAHAEACLHSFLTAYTQAHAALRSSYRALAEHKRALEQLPEVLVEGIPAIVYVAPWHGLPGEMLYVSPQAETVLGYAAPDWIADPHLWLSRLDPEDRDRALAERLAGTRQGAPFVSEYRLLHRDDRPVWFHDEARIVHDEAGRPLFWQGVLLEITQRKAAEQKATEAERTRLARELHDSVMQTLLAAQMRVRTLQKLWQRDPSATRSHIGELEDLMRTAVAELRVLLLEIHPRELTQTPLHRLIEQLVVAMRNRSNTAIAVSAVLSPTLAPDVQIAVYRITQEALNNVIRHSNARNARVLLHNVAERIHLTVTDDGMGFDPATVPGGQLGIHSMLERAALIGARLTIQSTPGAGTAVDLVWPSPPEIPR